MEAANREEWLPPSCCLPAARAGEPSAAEGAGAGASVAEGRLARMLSPECVPSRLVAELQNALEACAERQRQLERSLCISRRLLRAWYTDPKTTRLGFPRASEPLLEPLGQEARPGAHFRVASCWCPPPFPVVSEAGDLLQGQATL